jgi:hypothetical protein
MENKVMFEDTNRGSSYTIKRGYIMNLLLNKGIAKSESSANAIMLAFSIILIILSVYIVYSNFF